MLKLQRAWRACTNEGHQVRVSGGRREDMVLYAAVGVAGQAGVPADLWGEPRVCLYVGLLQCERRQVAEGGSIANGWSRACRYFREGFQKATADLVERELQRFERPEEVEIFFSAHGVPVSYVEQVRALGHASNLFSLACLLWQPQVMPWRCVWLLHVAKRVCVCASSAMYLQHAWLARSSGASACAGLADWNFGSKGGGAWCAGWRPILGGDGAVRGRDPGLGL